MGESFVAKKDAGAEISEILANESAFGVVVGYSETILLMPL